MSKLQKQTNLQTLADAAVKKAMQSGLSYAQDAINAGVLLMQVQAELADHNGGHFTAWLERYGEQSRGTLYRWIAAAKATWGKAFLEAKRQRLIEDGVTIDLPPENIATADAENRSQLQQLWLDLTTKTSIAEAIRSVADGESEPHRITRAVGGHLARQTSGDERKNFPKFIATALDTVSSHLSFSTGPRASKKWSFRELSQNQQARILVAFEAAVGRFPDWLVKELAGIASKEAKKGVAARAQAIGEHAAQLELIKNKG